LSAVREDRPASPEALLFAKGALWGPDESERSWPLLALLGDPVAHSLSPLLHEAALSAAKIEGSYRCVRVSATDLSICLDAARAASVAGLNVTLPHKERALQLCAKQSPLAARVGAANTLVPLSEGWEAHNTDVGGLQDALRQQFAQQEWSRECAIVGAGGAARAAVVALQELGATRIRVLARDLARASWVERLGVSVEALADAPLQSLSLLIQATPLGLLPQDPSPIDPQRLPAGCALMDLCYGAAPSRLLRAHRGRGPVADGRSMLCAQAQRAFRLWFPGSRPEASMLNALPPLSF
jgi:shikimate dehydrogenase